jgi:apolipoprotein N-acyltransferase
MRAVLALAGGAVSGLGFAPVGAWPLTLAGLALLLLLISGASRLRAALAAGWWFGLGHMLVGLHWIAHAFQFQQNMPAWTGWVAVVLLSMLMAVYPAVAAGLAWRIGRSGAAARVLALAGGWMLAEWLRGYLLGGFPWNPLGVVALPLLPVAQAASVVGGLGLSGLVVLAAGTFVLAADRAPASRRLAVGTALLVAAAAGSGLVALRSGPAAVADAPRVHIVQADIRQDDKWRPGAFERNLERYLTLSRAALARGPGLLLWPEAAVPAVLDEDPALIADLARLLGPNDLLLTGALQAIRDRRGEAIAAHNSLFVLDARGRLLDRFDKAALVPFGEYLPLRGILETIGVARLAPGDLDFWPGPGPRTLRLPGYPAVGPLICYEVVFPGNVVDDGDRPGWLLNASNDAWFSSAGAYMHLDQARLRAIEEGLPIARATPTGVSAMIDARGRVPARIGRGETGILTAAIPPALPPTIFARLGSLLPVLLALLLLLGPLTPALRRRS